MTESAGVPLPGETALVTAALLASQHKLQIPFVIGLAASAAIVGDNFGYLIGRKGAAGGCSSDRSVRTLTATGTERRHPLL